MTLNETIIAALTPLGLPVVPDVYTGTQSDYITFNFDALPRQFVGNVPVFYLCLIQVHLFASLEQDTENLRATIPRLLTGAGCTWPEIINATDKAGQHYVFECQTVRKNTMQREDK
jgi:hypothetical protein